MWTGCRRDALQSPAFPAFTAHHSPLPVPAGAFALLDQTELDWKVIAIAAEDPLAEEVNDILDVDRCVDGGAMCWWIG